MNAQTLLDKIATCGIRLSVESGNLKIRAKKGVMTDEIKAEIRNHKSELIEHLTVGKSQPKREPLPPVPEPPPLPEGFDTDPYVYLRYHLKTAAYFTKIGEAESLIEWGKTFWLSATNRKFKVNLSRADLEMIFVSLMQE